MGGIFRDWEEIKGLFKGQLPPDRTAQPAKPPAKPPSGIPEGKPAPFREGQIFRDWEEIKGLFKGQLPPDRTPEPSGIPKGGKVEPVTLGETIKSAIEGAPDVFNMSYQGIKLMAFEGALEKEKQFQFPLEHVKIPLADQIFGFGKETQANQQARQAVENVATELGNTVGSINEQLMDWATNKTADEREKVVRQQLVKAWQNYAAAEERLAEKTPDFEGQPFMEFIYDAAIMIEKMAPAIATGVLTTPGVGLTVMGGQVAGESYGARRGQGETTAEARAGAAVSGLVEAYTEQLPIKFVFKRGMPFMARMLAVAFGEGIQEGASAALQSAYDKGTIDPDMSMGEALRAIGYETLLGAAGGGILGTVAHVPHKIRQIQQQNQAMAEAAPEIQQMIADQGGGEVPLGIPPVEMQAAQRIADAETMVAQAEAQQAQAESILDSGPLYPPSAIQAEQRIAEAEAMSAQARQQPAEAEAAMEREEETQAAAQQQQPLSPDGLQLINQTAMQQIVDLMSQEMDQAQVPPAARQQVLEAVMLRVQQPAEKDATPAPTKKPIKYRSISDWKSKVRARYGISDSAAEALWRDMMRGDLPLEEAVKKYQKIPEELPFEPVVAERKKPIKKARERIPEGLPVEEAAQAVEQQAQARAQVQAQTPAQQAQPTAVAPAQAPAEIAAEAPVTEAQQQQAEAMESAEAIGIPNRTTIGGPAGGMGPVSPTDVLPPQQVTNKLAGTDLGPFLDTLRGPEDAKHLLRRVVQMYEPTMKRARRGVVPWKETEAMAAAAGWNPEVLQRRRHGQAFNAEEFEIAKVVVDKAMGEVLESAEKAVGGSDANLFQFQRRLDTFVPLVQQTLGARAEWGRAGSILRKQAMEADQLKNVLDMLGGRGTIEAKAAVLRDLKARGTNATALNRAVNKLTRARTVDMLIEAWLSSLLSGLQTHAVNMTSNFICVALSIPEHSLAATIGKLHGGEKVYFRETVARTYGLVTGVGEGLRAAAEAWKTETGRDVFDKLERAINRQPAIPGMTGKIIRGPLRALTAEDEFFKAVVFRSEIKALTLRQAIQEKARSPWKRASELEAAIDSLGERQKDMTNAERRLWAIHDKAVGSARYQTFTNPLGPVGQGASNFINRHPLPFKFMVPFLRTPVNIVKYAGHRSPLAVTMPSFWKMIQAGGADRDIALARLLFGMGIILTAMFMAANGYITGGGPKEANQRRVWLKRYQPYSIRSPFNSDEYLSYSRLEPIGMLLGVSADMANAWKAMSERDASASEIAGLAHMSVMQNLTSKTYLKGIADSVAAYYDPSRYFEPWYTGLMGTAIPTVLAQTARVQDPVMRRAENLTEHLMTRLPGLRQEIRPKLDLFGEPIALGGGWGPDMVSPIYLFLDRHDPVVEEMLRLEVFPGQVTNRIGGVTLTPDQHNEYIELAGRPAKAMLDQLVVSPEYQNAPAMVQRELIEKVFQETGRYARRIMAVKYPDLVFMEMEKKMEAFQ